MNTPITLGWPQLLLLIIVIVAVVLLASSISSLRGRYYIEKYRDEDGVYRHHRRRRRPKIVHGVFGLALLIVAIMLLWAASLIQGYVSLTSSIQVAHVRATPVTNISHLMSVDLTLYDQNGHKTSENTYVITGDEWMLQGDIIKFPAWMNLLGFHSGYKLTRLEGRFDDPNLESNSKHTVVQLNGGDDNFFKTAQQQAWTSPFVQAAYGAAAFVQPDGKEYNVYATQTGLAICPQDKPQCPQ